MKPFHAPRLKAHSVMAIADGRDEMPAYAQIRFAYDNLKRVTFHGSKKWPTKWAWVGKKRIYAKHLFAARHVKSIQSTIRKGRGK